MSKITIPENSILLLEGGSLRGLYTAGVLDTFMENGLYFPRRWRVCRQGRSTR